jgi:hypothetical protein
MMRAYLSGGMEYASDEGRSWREEMETWLGTTLGWEVFNPNRNSDELLARLTPDVPFRALKSLDPERYLAIVREIVALDSREVAEGSDCVICLWDEGAARGAGTKGELTIARHFGKPVYLVTRIPFEEIPGWVLGCVTDRFESFEKLKESLESKEEGRRKKARD